MTARTMTITGQAPSLRRDTPSRPPLLCQSRCSYRPLLAKLRHGDQGCGCGERGRRASEEERGGGGLEQGGGKDGSDDAADTDDRGEGAPGTAHLR